MTSLAVACTPHDAVRIDSDALMPSSGVILPQLSSSKSELQTNYLPVTENHSQRPNGLSKPTPKLEITH